MPRKSKSKPSMSPALKAATFDLTREVTSVGLANVITTGDLRATMATLFLDGLHLGSRLGSLHPEHAAALVKWLDHEAMDDDPGTAERDLNIVATLSAAAQADEQSHAQHPAATLTGGPIPAHVPGVYPSLSCCGGPVLLVAP